MTASTPEPAKAQVSISWLAGLVVVLSGCYSVVAICSMWLLATLSSGSLSAIAAAIAVVFSVIGALSVSAVMLWAIRFSTRRGHPVDAAHIVATMVAVCWIFIIGFFAILPAGPLIAVTSSAALAMTTHVVGTWLIRRVIVAENAAQPR